MKRLLLLFLLGLIFAVSCKKESDSDSAGSDIVQNKKNVIESSNYDDSVTEEDFNTTAINWMWAPTVFAQTDEGCYFIAGEYVFFADAASMTSVPLCSRTSCLHYNEQDTEKISDCEAFIGAGSLISGLSQTPYIAAFRDNLILTCLNQSTGRKELIRMARDGSHRVVLLSDLDSIDIPNIRLHRGVLYYFNVLTNIEGQKEISLCAISLLSSNKKSVEIYKSTGENLEAYMILPIRNHVYFETEILINDEKGEFTYHIYDMDICTGTVQEILQDEKYSIYGALKGKLILFDGSSYYEYSKESGIVESHELNGFTIDHPDLVAHADCIDDDLFFYSCWNKAENKLEEDQYITDASGQYLCSIPDEGWGYFGAQTVMMDGTEYYVRISTVLEPYRILTFKKSDLLNGNPTYGTLLSVDNYIKVNPAFVLPGEF